MPANPAAAKALFLEAVAIDDMVTRAALVNERCGEDMVLLARVNALLVANDLAVANEGTASLGVAGSDATDRTATAGAVAGVAGLTTDLPGRDEKVGAILGGKYKLI